MNGTNEWHQRMAPTNGPMNGPMNQMRCVKGVSERLCLVELIYGALEGVQRAGVCDVLAPVSHRLLHFFQLLADSRQLVRQIRHSLSGFVVSFLRPVEVLAVVLVLGAQRLQLIVDVPLPRLRVTGQSRSFTVRST